MSFAKEKTLINYPSRWFTVFHILVALALIWYCVSPDDAKGAGYFTIPVFSLLSWCWVSDIGFRKTPKISMCVWAFCFLFWIAGSVVMMQVISVKDGDPIFKTGPFYEISALMAKQPQN